MRHGVRQGMRVRVGSSVRAWMRDWSPHCTGKGESERQQASASIETALTFDCSTSVCYRLLSRRECTA